MSEQEGAQAVERESEATDAQREADAVKREMQRGARPWNSLGPISEVSFEQAFLFSSYPEQVFALYSSKKSWFLPWEPARIWEFENQLRATTAAATNHHHHLREK